MKTIALLLSAFIAFALPAFACDKPLMCDGDSQTLRRSPLVAGQPWCEILAARKNQAVLNNFATSGATSATVLSRVSQHLALGPVCASIMVGVNDAWSQEFSPAQTKSNIISIVRQHKAAGNNVTLFLSFPFWSSDTLARYPAYARAIREAAASENVPLIDAYTVENLDRCWLYPAGHPEYAKCEAAYIANEPTYHPSVSASQAIADLCLKPENQNACACATQ